MPPAIKTRIQRLNTKKLRDVIGFNPHKKQWEVLDNRTRFTTLCWGRRSGKTLLGSYIAFKYLLSSNRNIWVVAPTYDLAHRSWDYLIHWANLVNKSVNGSLLKINKTPPYIQSYTGSKLELKSADQPASLLGKGLDLVIVDEAARIPVEIWNVYLRPTLTERQGKALFISTPFGKNWFYDMMLKGVDKDKKYDDFSYFHMKTSDNEAIPRIEEEIAKVKQELPANDFAQEYDAEFIEGSGSVFRGVKNCLYDVNFRSFPFVADTYQQDHAYQGGLDLARLTDFSVSTVVDRSTAKFKVVAVDRFNEIDWQLQKPRILNQSSNYHNPPFIAERNNIGDSIIGDLTPNFESFLTTNQSKKDLINNLAILIEQQKILIPNIPVLVSELEAFSYEMSPSGNIVYQAPGGYHDDFVMSLALAVKDLKDPVSNERQDTYILPTNFVQEEY